jgi:hypothetical protein
VRVGSSTASPCRLGVPPAEAQSSASDALLHEGERGNDKLILKSQPLFRSGDVIIFGQDIPVHESVNQSYESGSRRPINYVRIWILPGHFCAG